MKTKIDSELANKIYDDGLKDPVKETSSVISLVPRAIKAALEPLETWILEKEYKIKETKLLLEKKLKNISEEKIVPPEPFVAIPAIQAISYSMNNEELRNLYANLLAKAMNTDTKDQVHPAFTEIIKQLSPIDAILLKRFLSNATPLIDVIERKFQNSDYRFLITNLTNIFDYKNNIISVSIDNLIRLGLIKILSNQVLSENSIYETILSGSPFIKFKETYNSSEGYIDILKKVLIVTDLGYQFSKICIEDF